jgi:radical SAM superfamily enzyme YgiQ (UPF0313 family)
MKDVGFRMVLFGVGSANQKTLDRIQKGVKVEDIEQVKKAAEAGLEPHIAVMFGYPWETEEDAQRTLKLVHKFLVQGWAKTAQASFYTPPQGTPRMDQRRFVKKLYSVGLRPDFWIRKIRDIKNIDDFRYLMRQIREGLFHG